MSNLNENSVSQSRLKHTEAGGNNTRIKVQHARMTLIRNFWSNASGIITQFCA